ncbi:histidine kinase [Nonomuraea sp. NPDC050786]|uniref:sensor histidine kinase n=1 Tax=Nonomuraea sp. NPDC050786 TaxID=3154840 RepID=UPI0033E4B47E
MKPAALLIWFLCALWGVRVSSHFDHGAGPTLVVVTVTLVALLQLPISLPFRPPVLRAWLLVAQAVINYLPLLVTPDTWWTGGSAFVAASVLLVVRGPFAWPLFALVAVFEGVVAFLLGRETGDIYHAIVAPLNAGLVLYGLSDLIGMADRVRQERDELAARAEEVERLRLWRHTRGLLLTSLSTVERLVERARSHQGEVAEEEITRAVSVARETLARVRSLPPAPDPAPFALPVYDWRVVRLATPSLVLVHLIFIGQAAFNLTLHGADPGAGDVVGMALLPVTFGLQLRHLAAARAGGRSKGWTWTLPLQALATYLSVALGAESGLIVSGFLGGVVLLYLAAPASWLLCAVIVGVSGVSGVFSSGPVIGAYSACSTLLASVAVYGLTRLTRLVVELRRTQAESVQLAALREQLRAGRDLHDLLGRGLTTVIIHGELALRLLSSDPVRARVELRRVADAARSAMSDTDGLRDRVPRLRLADELAAAETALEAAGARVRTAADQPPGGAPVPDPLGSVLALVLREAVTNVLRHSSPKEVVIELTSVGGRVRLRVVNDGAGRAAPPTEAAAAPAPGMGAGCVHRHGSGLRNLRARLEAVDGLLTVVREGDRFELHAEAPVDHEVLTPRGEIGDCSGPGGAGQTAVAPRRSRELD